MAKKNSELVQHMLAEHRAAVARIIGQNVAPVRKLHHDAILDVQARLAAVLARGDGDTFTAHNLREALAQLRAGVTEMTMQMGASLTLTNQETQVESLAQVNTNIGRLESIYKGAYQQLPIEAAARFLGVIDKNQTSLLASHSASLARYGTQLIGQTEQVLATSIAAGATGHEVMVRVQNTMQNNYWQAERIARTEGAWSFNAAQSDGLAIAAQTLPDLYQRWTEYVDDTTGRPFDARVAGDSMVLHGQIAAAGGSFVMPADGRANAKIWGLSWAFPPNRPHDRSSLIPWRPHWSDIPAYLMLAGTRTEVDDAMRKQMTGHAAGKTAVPQRIHAPVPGAP